MPKSPLHKTLQEYISNIKKTPSSSFRLSSKSISVSTKRLIRGCRHPKTHSFAMNDSVRDETHKTGKNGESATLDDVDRFLFENFKSLYMNDKNDDEENKFEVLNEPPKINKSPALLDFCGTHRFFVSSGSSNSLAEDAGRTSVTLSDDVALSSPTTTIGTSSVSAVPDTTITIQDSKEIVGPDDYIVLLTYSPSPYDDFKRSMQEMIDARFQCHGKVNWEFMEELLSCYMDLNDKRSYKHIASAFVDLFVTLREDSGKFKTESQKKKGTIEEILVKKGFEGCFLF